MTRRIVDALQLKLTPAQTARAAGLGTNNIEALDLLMRGRAFLGGATQNLEVFRRATDLLRRSIEHDPVYLEAYSALALAYCFDYVNRWTDDPDASLDEAQRLADRSIELAPNEAQAHDTASMTASFANNSDRFRREAQAALALDPNYPGAHFLRGQLCLSTGEPLDAVPHFERAMRIDPSLGTTLRHLQLLGMAYFIGGRYETAAALFRERILLMPNTDWSRGYLASALGHLRKFEEARRVWPELMTINPKYAMAERLNRTAVQPRRIEMVLDGARKAGLPV